MWTGEKKQKNFRVIPIMKSLGVEMFKWFLLDVLMINQIVKQET